MPILQRKTLAKLKEKDRRIIVNAIIAARKQSYQSGLKKKEKLKEDLRKILIR